MKSEVTKASRLQVGHFVKRFSILTLGETAARLSNILLLIVLPFMTTLDNFGAIILLASTELLCSTIFLLGLDRVVLRFYTDRRQEGELVGHVLQLWAGWTIVSFTALLIAALFVNPLTKIGIPLFPDLFLFMVGNALFSLHRLLLAVQRARRDHALYAATRSLSQLSKLGIVLALVGSLRGTMAYSIALLISAMIAVGFQLRTIPCSFGHRGAAQFSKVALPFALPLLMHVIVGEVLGKADRFILQSMLGNDAVGTYGAISTVGSSITFFSALVVLNLEPSIYRAGSHAAFMLRFQRALILIGGGLCATVLLPVATLLYFPAIGINYPVARSLAYVLAGHLVLAFYLEANCRLVLRQRTFLMPIVTAAVATCSILLNMWLIPRAGIEGAAFASFLSHTLLAAALQALSLRGDGEGFAAMAAISQLSPFLLLPFVRSTIGLSLIVLSTVLLAVLSLARDLRKLGGRAFYTALK